MNRFILDHRTNFKNVLFDRKHNFRFMWCATYQSNIYEGLYSLLNIVLIVHPNGIQDDHLFFLWSPFVLLIKSNAQLLFVVVDRNYLNVYKIAECHIWDMKYISSMAFKLIDIIKSVVSSSALNIFAKRDYFSYLLISIVWK